MPLSLTTTLSASANVVDVAEVPPSTIFSSAAVASTAANFVKSACTNPDTPSSKFSSVAVAVTFVPPMSSVVTDISPATVTTPFANVIKSVSSVCPMLEPLINTSSISS